MPTSSATQAELDVANAADYLSDAGDVLAEILGRVLASSEDGPVADHVLAGARQGILTWHRLRARVHPRR